jgi:hypothetical protein
MEYCAKPYSSSSLFNFIRTDLQRAQAETNGGNRDQERGLTAPYEDALPVLQQGAGGPDSCRAGDVYREIS